MQFLKLCILIAMQAVLVQPSFSAQPVGRLFSTPAERNKLDYLRQTKKVIVATPIQSTTQPTESAPVDLPDAISLQGYVKRNDGKQGTVWINDQAMQENSANQDVQVGRLPENGNRIPLKLPANGQYLTLKAGQIYDPESNRVREAKNHGAQGDSGTIGEDNF